MLTCYCINLTSFVPHDDVMWNYFCVVSINSLPPKSCPIQPLDSSFPIPIIHPFVKVERTHSKFYMAGFSPLPYRHLKPTPTPTPYTLRTPTTHTPYLTPHTSHCKSSYSYTHIAILPPLSSLRQASMTIWRELWWARPGLNLLFFQIFYQMPQLFNEQGRKVNNLREYAVKLE